MTDSSIPPFRLCKRCNTEYPLTTEYFHRSKAHAFGLSFTCKSCAKYKSKTWRQENPERNKDNIDRWKSEHPDRVKQLSLQGMNRRRVKFQAYSRERYWRNKEAFLLKASIGYYKHREKRRNKAKEWRSNNPEANSVYRQRRRARMKNAKGDHSSNDIKHLYEQQEGKCGYCGISIYWVVKRDVQIDHVVPISRGGSNSADNLVICCGICNASKHNKTLDEWLPIRGW